MIEQRAEAIAQAAAARLRTRVAEQIRVLIPDADVAIEGDAVTVAARGLERRRDADPALRWIAGAMR